MSNMQKLAIKLDLSAFFEDERKQVLLLVDPRWEYVEALEKRVERLFQLVNICFLTDGGYYLPSSESIDLVKCCDVLRVTIAKGVKNSKRHHKNEPSAHTNTTNTLDSLPKAKKFKRKFCSLQNTDFSSSSEISSSNVFENADVNLMGDELPFNDTKLKRSSNKKKKISNVAETMLSTESTLTDETLWVEELAGNTTKSSENSRLLSNGNIATTRHTFLDTPVTDNTENEKCTSVNVTFRCALAQTESMKRARIFHIENSKQNISSKPNSVQIQEVVLIPSLPLVDKDTDCISDSMQITSEDVANNISNEKIDTSITNMSGTQSNDDSFVDESSVIAVDSDDENQTPNTINVTDSKKFIIVDIVELNDTNEAL